MHRTSTLSNSLNSFGSIMEGRSYEGDTNLRYRFGFNGQENDNEVSGKGNTNTAQFWEYDTRLVRRWNLDPQPQVDMSDYSCFGNSPNIMVDPLGDSKESKHLDPNGKLIAEYDDGDASTYKHQTAKTKKEVDKWRAKFGNTSGNGVMVYNPIINFGTKPSETSLADGLEKKSTPNSNSPVMKNEVAPQQSGQSGFEGAEHLIGPTLVVLGQPLLKKPFTTPGSSPGTSVASKVLNKVLPFKSSVKLPSVISNSSGTRIVYTKSIGKFAGRWVPFVGWGLMIYDFSTTVASPMGAGVSNYNKTFKDSGIIYHIPH